MFDIWQEIFGTISRNKLRTALTGFAVAWGIFILIVLLGAGNGLIHAFSDSMNNQKLNSIEVYPGFTGMPYEGLREGRRIQLTNRELKLTQEQFPEFIEKTGAMVEQGNITLSTAADYTNVSLSGVHPVQQDIDAIRLTEGRFINETDIRERRKVIVLLRRTAEVLFPRQTHFTGQIVRAGNVAYRITGIYEDRQSSSSSTAYIPFTTLQTIYNKGNQLGSIAFLTRGLTDEIANEAFEQQYRRAIARQQRFDPTDSSAIWIWNQFTSYLQSVKGMQILRTSIWVVGILTLLSGIVGVSNIMLITVKERTREFGIRKALGAKPRSILGLILTESVTITTIFGYLGMVAGIAATEWMNLAFGNQQMDNGVWSTTVFSNPTVDLSIALQATLTLIVAGTLAGFFPARKAAGIRPIEALRAE